MVSNLNLNNVSVNSVGFIQITRQRRSQQMKLALNNFQMENSYLNFSQSASQARIPLQLNLTQVFIYYTQFDNFQIFNLSRESSISDMQLMHNTFRLDATG